MIISLALTKDSKVLTISKLPIVSVTCVINVLLEYSVSNEKVNFQCTHLRRFELSISTNTVCVK